ncbi:hypothetical protein SAMN04487866_10859 [Thermoactinomyces sp. DSM 45891]|uniref:hypothetical protein n=1 Tax=Thermoactinomyces sp. DSM 45891 TaxID=1761907 RepID=UPI00091B4F78|nr:hypothetical protein [Thermoactinomyces sp. DSM 45891]SFX45292.1 hypothetical protein SAMN04487866_10859 [Thermoactinomyces sp. DSM 45891]
MNSKKKFLLRLDPDLYQDLEKWAADEFRSVNAQIEFILRSSVSKHRKPGQSKDKQNTEGDL